MRQRFFLIFNAAAGTSRVSPVARLVALLEAKGAIVARSLATTVEAARKEAAEAARSGHFDALIACGGDGTMRQAAAAAAGTETPVGGFMLGTGNVLAHELRLPRDPVAAAALFRNGPTMRVRMGLANADPFLLMAGVGFDGRVVAGLNQRLKRSVAKVAYVPATLKALGAPLDDLTVTIDGEAHSGVAWVIVSSASCYGGAFRLTQRTRLTEEGLVAHLFYAHRKMDLIRHNLNIVRGRLDDIWRHPGSKVFISTCNVATITSQKPVPVQVDGDDCATTPLRVEAAGPYVHLIAPPQ